MVGHVLHEGHQRGDRIVKDPLAAAHALVRATNALFRTPSVGELGKRKKVNEQVGRIADLLLDGLRRRR